jgi:ubiquinol-cytochrome c reductase cytochrome c subunit
VSNVKTCLATTVIALLTGAAALATQTPPPAPAGDVENGRKLYVKTGCASCHGLEGQGAPTSGPRIGPNPLALAAFIKYIRSPKNQMPPYSAKVMSDQELTDVRAFLAARPKPAAVTVVAP